MFPALNSESFYCLIFPAQSYSFNPVFSYQDVIKISALALRLHTLNEDRLLLFYLKVICTDIHVGGSDSVTQVGHVSRRQTKDLTLSLRYVSC